MFDGFSEAYGASTGDLIADGAGALILPGSEKALVRNANSPEVFIPHNGIRASSDLKCSAKVRSESLKDYNGQTYWFSVDLDKFFRFPKWLNIAAGYGAEGMVYARDCQQLPTDFQPHTASIISAIDPDLTAIRTRSKVVKTILFFANMIKIPAPTLEISGNGVRASCVLFLRNCGFSFINPIGF